MDSTRKRFKYTAPRTIRVGVVGSGYVGSHFVTAFDGYQGLKISAVLSRRSSEIQQSFVRPDLLVSAIDELLEKSDVVFECSGDAVYAADIVNAAFRASRPVVTMNAEFHVTAGSYFADKGLLSEAEGDQPGSLAALNERIVEMGFRPLAYCNMKAFMNHRPSLEDMLFWAGKKGISLDKVTSFTDGTKLQIEQALVANGLNASIDIQGMHGLRTSNLDDAADFFGSRAKESGKRLSDYILYPNAPHGVFIVAEHDKSQHAFLEHVKMGQGPFYVLTQSDVLVHLQAPRTIRSLVQTGKALLTNSSTPSVNVAAIAKAPLVPGQRISCGIGSFEVRGECVSIVNEPDAVPIGLLKDAVLRRKIVAGEILRMDDVELPETLALKAWLATRDRVLGEEQDDLSATLERSSITSIRNR
ncbi:MAG: NAD(P)-dependent oxidoreductase [Rhodothermales bacterium]|nr:NAD(P)-dependent oxidoreductase [Rhodothermales bacterium]